MSYALAFKKSIVSKTFYLQDIFLSNFAFFFQAIISLGVGLYFHQINPVFTFNNLLLYYIFGSGVITVMQRTHVVRDFCDEVVKGNIGVYFSKPFMIIPYFIAKELGGRIYRALVQGILMYVVIGLVFTFPLVTVDVFFRFFVGFILSTVFIYLVLMFFMYFALISERIEEFDRVFRVSSYFLGGGLIPLAYLPVWLDYLPQRFFYASPIEYILTGTFPFLGLYFLYLAILLFVIVVLHKYTIRRLVVNGG